MDEAAAGLGDFLKALKANTEAIDANSAALHRLGDEFSKLSANAPGEGDARKTPAERLAVAAAEAGAEELARNIRRFFRGR